MLLCIKNVTQKKKTSRFLPRSPSEALILCDFINKPKSCLSLPPTNVVEFLPPRTKLLLEDLSREIFSRKWDDRVK